MLAFWQYQQIVKSTADEKKRDVDGQAVILALRKTSSDFIQALCSNISQSQEVLKLLKAFLLTKCADHTPSFFHINNALEEFSAHMQFALKEIILPSVTSSVVDVHSNTEGEKKLTSHRFHINNREQAMIMLKVVSNFFKQQEPQSPIPCLIDRAIRWGELSLAQLLEKLITNEQERENALVLSGAKDYIEEYENDREY